LYNKIYLQENYIYRIYNYPSQFDHFLIIIYTSIFTYFKTLQKNNGKQKAN
jgi:hypothetical protein